MSEPTATFGLKWRARMSSGVMRAAPPTPVKPTMAPTSSPAREYRGSILSLPYPVASGDGVPPRPDGLNLVSRQRSEVGSLCILFPPAWLSGTHDGCGDTWRAKRESQGDCRDGLRIAVEKAKVQLLQTLPVGKPVLALRPLSVFPCRVGDGPLGDYSNTTLHGFGQRQVQRLLVGN